MASARGYANHSLYMARLLIDGWQQGVVGAMPAAVDAAYAPAVRLHLLDAYGWFLLAMTRITQLPPQPPHRVHELPDLGEGIETPGEVLEYAQLERDGWLRLLQTPLPAGLPKRSRGPVLAVTSSYPSRDDFVAICGHFETLFSRMSDSLDES